MSEQIKEKFLNFITRNFLIERDEIDLDKSLVDEGIIDSFGLIEIAAYMEKEYGIVVTEQQMTRDNFGSVIRIVNFIANNMNNDN